MILLNTAQYSEHLTPASDTNRDSMKRCLNEQNFRSGGTDFKIAVDAGSTSMCQKAIIFLTDGTTAMSKNHNVSVQQQVQTFHAGVFDRCLGLRRRPSDCPAKTVGWSALSRTGRI